MRKNTDTKLKEKGKVDLPDCLAKYFDTNEFKEAVVDAHKPPDRTNKVNIRVEQQQSEEEESG